MAPFHYGILMLVALASAEELTKKEVPLNKGTVATAQAVKDTKKAAPSNAQVVAVASATQDQVRELEKETNSNICELIEPVSAEDKAKVTAKQIKGNRMCGEADDGTNKAGCHCPKDTECGFESNVKGNMYICKMLGEVKLSLHKYNSGLDLGDSNPDPKVVVSIT